MSTPTSGHKKIRTIVITGGPCGGKTTAMSWLQNALTSAGYAVIFLTETFTELANAGVSRYNCRDNFAASLSELLSFVSEPWLTRENVALEKKIILQEAAMYVDSPSSRLMRGALRQLYREHPIRDEIVGTPGSIKRITPSHLLRVYRAFYHPGNMQLFVAGDLTPDDLLSALSDVVMPTRDGDFRVPPAPETGKNVSSVSVTRRRVSKPLFAVMRGFPEPPGTPLEQHREMLALSVVNAHLFGESGALYNDLKDRGLVTSPLRCVVEWNPGVCFIYASGQTSEPRKVYAAIRERIRDLITAGIPAADLGYVAIAKGLGVVQGDRSGAFRPADGATRQELAVMLYRYLSR